jgi:hypothetical protein
MADAAPLALLLAEKLRRDRRMAAYRWMRSNGALAIEAWCFLVGRRAPRRHDRMVARCLRRSRRGVIRNIDANNYRWTWVWGMEHEWWPPRD